VSMTSAATDFDAWAAGVLPAWARVSAERYAHIARVAALMDRWADAFGSNERERTRWRTAAWMHDALRDAPPADIRDGIVDPVTRAWPDSLLHGPAAADRMAADGYTDAEVLDAVRYHTVGDAGLGRLGLALIAADALEPGRTQSPVWRAALRARLPLSFDDVILEVIADKLRRNLESVRPLRAGMVELWNRLAADAPDGRAVDTRAHEADARAH
jgi:HD superfamily phosphohydrolase YqeK